MRHFRRAVMAARFSFFFFFGIRNEYICELFVVPAFVFKRRILDGSFLMFTRSLFLAFKNTDRRCPIHGIFAVEPRAQFVFHSHLRSLIVHTIHTTQHNTYNTIHTTELSLFPLSVILRQCRVVANIHIEGSSFVFIWNKRG